MRWRATPSRDGRLTRAGHTHLFGLGSGIFYFAGALVLAGVFLYYCADFALQRSVASARRLLLASIVYLPLLFALLALDKKQP
jgi:protoheme IX farnesyltransferase